MRILINLTTFVLIIKMIIAKVVKKNLLVRVNSRYRLAAL